MARCSVCRTKEVELLTRWERIRYWLFNRVNYAFFPDDFDDLKNDRYTQGFSDGNLAGFTAGVKTFERQFKHYGN